MQKKHIYIAIIIICIVIYIYFFPKTKEVIYHPLDKVTESVYIEGEVMMPGTYIIESGKTLGYLIHLAGGLTPYADISGIDLKIIIDKSYYKIPGYEKIEDDKIIKINLNQASYDELIKVPYINEDKALEILLYRKEMGSFKTVDELINIKGIGEKTLEKIRVYFTV